VPWASEVLLNIISMRRVAVEKISTTMSPITDPWV
jgi:hypothetical protein